MRTQTADIHVRAARSQPTARCIGEPGVAGDDGLRAALARLVLDGFTGRREWELIGAVAVSLAERDSSQWRRHRIEYQSAYLAAAVELLRENTQTVIDARSPWGLVVATGRLAGHRAVSAAVTGGLTDRDPASHRTRFGDVPRVVSLERILERANRSLAS